MTSHPVESLAASLHGFPSCSSFAISVIANNDGRFRAFSSFDCSVRVIRIAFPRHSRKRGARCHACLPAMPRVVRFKRIGSAFGAITTPHPADTSKMKHPGRRTPSCIARACVTSPCRSAPTYRICRKSVTRNPCKPGVCARHRWSRRYRSPFGMLAVGVDEMTPGVVFAPRINAETFSHTCPTVPAGGKI